MKVHIVKLLLLFIFLFLPAVTIAGDVSISIAGSLRDVINELTRKFTAENSMVRLKTNIGGSGALAKQIASGAPADIFISANTEWIEFLKGKKLLDEKNISVMAYNALVFVGKPDLKIRNLNDITTLDKIAIGSPGSVPAGQYAMQAVINAGIEKKLENKLVMAKDVRECLMYAEKGEVSGAFVYKTDAEELASRVVILFTVPQRMYSRVTYPMALTKEGSKNPEALSFYLFLQSGETKKVLIKHGFVIK